MRKQTSTKRLRLSVLGEYDVFTLPDMTRIVSEKMDGRTHFETGDILGYKAFLLK